MKRIPFLCLGLTLAVVANASPGEDFKVLTWNGSNNSKMWDWTEGQSTMSNPINLSAGGPIPPLFHDIDYDNAGNLYGISISGDKRFYRVNPNTGVATPLGGLHDHVEGDFGYDPVLNRLVAVTSLAGTVTATQFDLNNNTSSLLWTSSGLDDISGVAFNSSGQGFLIDTKANSGGIAQLYSFNNSGLSFIGSLGIGFGVTLGMDFDANDQLHVLTGGGSLYHISGTTATFGGNVSNSAGQRVVGLAYKPVPEPATLATLGVGAIALIRRRVRVKK